MRALVNVARRFWPRRARSPIRSWRRARAGRHRRADRSARGRDLLQPGGAGLPARRPLLRRRRRPPRPGQHRARQRRHVDAASRCALDTFVGLTWDLATDTLTIGLAVYTPFTEFSSYPAIGPAALLPSSRRPSPRSRRRSPAPGRSSATSPSAPPSSSTRAGSTTATRAISAPAGGSAVVSQPNALCGGAPCGYENPLAAAADPPARLRPRLRLRRRPHRAARRSRVDRRSRTPTTKPGGDVALTDAEARAGDAGAGPGRALRRRPLLRPRSRAQPCCPR